MSGKNIIFYDKKINKCDFYKNKKLFNIYDIMLIKYQFLKKNLLVRKAHSDTFLEIMMMMPLDIYV